MSAHRSASPLHPFALVLGALLVVVATLAARPAVEGVLFTGRVVAEGTGAPLTGAQVYASGTRYGALTDADGRYSFEVPRTALASAHVRVGAMLIGYALTDTLVRVPEGLTDEPVVVDFRLRLQAVGIDQIIVVGGGAARREAADATVAPPAPAEAARRAGDVASARAALAPTAFEAVRSDAAPRPRISRWPGGDREQYAAIEENGFRSADDHPLSTFSIDVDRASYSNVRRFLLREGRLPPVDAVQIEEMVNYFAYDYARPRGRDPVAVTTELGAAPWAPEHRLLRVGLASRPVAAEDMPPANLVFLVDVSGSMSSPDKLPLVKASLRMLVHRLRPEDRVALVVYAGAAGLVLPPTSGRDRHVILDAVERLEAGGSTAGGAGLRLAYEVARRHFRRGGNNRVILATDGDFNVGESSDGAMVRLVEEERRGGTFLTVLGFGTGNLQAEKMQQVAQHGNGNYAYIDGPEEARKVLVREMGGTLLTVAKDVKVQIEFNPSRVRAYRLIGYENRLLAAEDFNDDRKDAGEVGAGHTVTALYEIVPLGVDVRTGDVDPLRYRGAPRRVESDEAAELAFVKVRYKRPEGGESRLLTHPVSAEARRRPSDDFTFAAAVAGFGMLLRGSEYRGAITPDQVLALARDGVGEDPDGDRREFVEMVRAYCAMETWRMR